MTRMLLLVTLICLAGCAGRRAGWGFGAGQGTTESQRSRAIVHDPFPLNDIGPEVLGGRPREYFDPQAEPVRNNAFPQSFSFGQ